MAIGQSQLWNDVTAVGARFSEHKAIGKSTTTMITFSSDVAGATKTFPHAKQHPSAGARPEDTENSEYRDRDFLFFFTRPATTGFQNFTNSATSRVATRSKYKWRGYASLGDTTGWIRRGGSRVYNTGKVAIFSTARRKQVIKPRMTRIVIRRKRRRA